MHSTLKLLALSVALLLPGVAQAADPAARTLAITHLSDQQAFMTCTETHDCLVSVAAAVQSNSALTRRLTTLYRMRPTPACRAASKRYNAADTRWMTSVRAFAIAPTTSTHDASARIGLAFARTIVPALKACD